MCTTVKLDVYFCCYLSFPDIFVCKSQLSLAIYNFQAPLKETVLDHRTAKSFSVQLGTKINFDPFFFLL